MGETGDLFAALEAGETGMRRAVDHAERDAPGWQQRALDGLRWYARTADKPFMIDTARSVIPIDDPPDARAWGAVVQAAIRKGYLIKTGAFALSPSSNGSPKALYVKGPAA